MGQSGSKADAEDLCRTTNASGQHIHDCRTTNASGQHIHDCPFWLQDTCKFANGGVTECRQGRHMRGVPQATIECRDWVRDGLCRADCTYRHNPSVRLGPSGNSIGRAGELKLLVLQLHRQY